MVHSRTEPTARFCPSRREPHGNQLLTEPTDAWWFIPGQDLEVRAEENLMAPSSLQNQPMLAPSGGSQVAEDRPPPKTEKELISTRFSRKPLASEGARWLSGGRSSVSAACFRRTVDSSTGVSFGWQCASASSKPARVRRVA